MLLEIFDSFLFLNLLAIISEACALLRKLKSYLLTKDFFLIKKSLL